MGFVTGVRFVLFGTFGGLEGETVIKMPPGHHIACPARLLLLQCSHR